MLIFVNNPTLIFDMEPKVDLILIFGMEPNAEFLHETQRRFLAFNPMLKVVMQHKTEFLHVTQCSFL